MKKRMADNILDQLMDLREFMQAEALTELEAGPAVADPAATGAAIDGAVSTPTPELGAAPVVAEALVMEGLGLGNP